MKKWHIYILVFVLTIALMGLVYVQSVYVKRGLYVQNQIFDQYANEAILRVALRLEEEHAFQVLQNPNISKLYNKAKNINGNCGMSLEYQNGLLTLDIQKENGIYTFTGTSLEEIDSLVKYADLGKDIEYELNQGLIQSYNQMVEDMAKQFLYSQESVIQFDSLKIYNYIQYELNRIAINTPFNFALLDGYNLRTIISSFEKITSSIQKKSYKTPVHVGMFNSNHAILLIDFPQKRSFLLQSNKGLLTLSFIFTLLIVLSFGASIYIIFRQKKLSELKTDFINNMTHELKTPVATISLATEMLSKPKVREDENKVSNYNTIIKDENIRLGTHIERVLQIAQIDKDTFRLEKQTVDIHEIINEQLIKFQLQLDAINAAIFTDLNAENSLIKGDKNHLSHALSNLIDNAIKYRKIEEPLQIRIHTINDNKQLKISVEDNGIGMTKSDSKKIFTKFYRVSTGNIHNVKGFGLGLSYVKSIIEAHNGIISVDSEINKYTKFHVTLPNNSKLSI